MLAFYLSAMVVLAWAAVITGAYIIYPPQRTYDECTDTRGRMEAKKRIAKTSKPKADPVYGRSGPLLALWSRKEKLTKAAAALGDDIERLREFGQRSRDQWPPIAPRNHYRTEGPRWCS